MSFGALRSIFRPVSKALSSYRITSVLSPTPAVSIFPALSRQNPWIPASMSFIHSLTDTRFPKRRPVDKPRKKRASLRPAGVWGFFGRGCVLLHVAMVIWTIYF